MSFRFDFIWTPFQVFMASSFSLVGNSKNSVITEIDPYGIHCAQMSWFLASLIHHSPTLLTPGFLSLVYHSLLVPRFKLPSVVIVPRNWLNVEKPQRLSCHRHRHAPSYWKLHKTLLSSLKTVVDLTYHLLQSTFTYLPTQKLFLQISRMLFFFIHIMDFYVVIIQLQLYTQNFT